MARLRPARETKSKAERPRARDADPGREPRSRSVARLRLELATLKAIAEAGHVTPPAELVRTLLSLVAHATESLHVSVYLRDPSSPAELVQSGSFGPTLGIPRWSRVAAKDNSLAPVLAGQAAIRAVKDLPGELPTEMPKIGLCHGLALPMQIQGRSIGIMNLWRTKPYRRSDLASAQVLADPIALQLERARLDAEARRRAQDLTVLNELGRVIAEQLDLSSVLTLGLELVVERAGVAHGFVLLCEGEVLRFVASTIAGHDAFAIAPDERSIANLALYERRAVVANEAATDPRVSTERTTRYGETAVLAVPMLSRGDVLGVVVLGQTEPDRRFTPEHVDRAVALTNQLATAVVNARLFDEAMASYRELRRTQEHLVQRERLAALGELAAVVAHEIRNPLAVIFNSVASLRRRPADDASSNLLLEIVGEEAERINHIITLLLDFARPGEPKVAPHDMEAVLAGALEAARHAAGKNGGTVEVQVARPVGTISADAQLIRQALINLLTNAIQADPEGPVKVRLFEETRLGRRFARVDVEDNGGGIDASVLPYVFQPFFTTKAQGTGLGLAIVKRIAEAHHGEVNVSSAGGATTFSLLLPSAPSRDEPA